MDEQREAAAIQRSDMEIETPESSAIRPRQRQTKYIYLKKPYIVKHFFLSELQQLMVKLFFLSNLMSIHLFLQMIVCNKPQISHLLQYTRRK